MSLCQLIVSSSHLIVSGCVSSLMVHCVSSLCQHIGSLCQLIVPARCFSSLCQLVVSARCVSSLCLLVVPAHCVIVSAHCVHSLCRAIVAVHLFNCIHTTAGVGCIIIMSIGIEGSQPCQASEPTSSHRSQMHSATRTYGTHSKATAS